MIRSENTITLSVVSVDLNFSNLIDGAHSGPYGDSTRGNDTYACRPAETPWIQSQEISQKRHNLFRFITRGFGSDTNQQVKVGVFNVKTPGTSAETDYATFSVVVRAFDDTDARPAALETFTNLSLDPAHVGYLPRVIGDAYNVVNADGKLIENGDYPNKSDFIRVEMTSKRVPVDVMPYGHDAYMSPWSVAGTDVDVTYHMTSAYSANPGKYFSGASFSTSGTDGSFQYPSVARDTRNLFAPIPDNASKLANGFYLDETGTYIEEDDNGDFVDVTVTGGISTSPASADELATAKQRKFLVGFQRGFDGINPSKPINKGADITSTNQQGFDCAKRATSGSDAYSRVFTALVNQDEYDINMIVAPGLDLEQHRYVVNRQIDVCETREDCFTIIDPIGANGQPGRKNDAINAVASIDSNYVAAYYPWVKTENTASRKIEPTPPSAVLPAVYAQNDKVAAEWFAPAGLNRGGIENAVDVLDKLTHADRDDLYEGRVNPIASFPQQGIVPFGQKTLQHTKSALDRINVRRLLINVKKFIASSSRYLLFDQNTTATRNQFLNIANPYLEMVQERQGLYAFDVVMDESNNPPDLVDRNILYGQIRLQPAKAVEFIVIDFTITRTGATFN